MHLLHDEQPTAEHRFFFVFFGCGVRATVCVTTSMHIGGCRPRTPARPLRGATLPLREALSSGGTIRAARPRGATCTSAPTITYAMQPQPV